MPIIEILKLSKSGISIRNAYLENWDNDRQNINFLKIIANQFNNNYYEIFRLENSIKNILFKNEQKS
jgi:hypothetical protein